MPKVCDIIKSRRKEMRLTQSDLANAAGVSRLTVIHWEKGTLPSLKNMTALEAALELPRGSLLIMASY